MAIRAVSFEPVALYRKPAYNKPGYGFRITNLDEVNTVYFETDNLTVTSQASSPLPQQASVTFDGTKDVWMSSGVIGRTVLVDFSPSSLTYDNPVGVQIALNALGLATAANQTSGGQIAQPAVPNMQFASVINQGVTSGVNIAAPAADYRLWSAWLSFAAGSDNSYAAAIAQMFATIEDPAGNVLLGIELVIEEPFQVVNDSIFATFPGLPFTPADPCVLNVNGGSAISNIGQRASAGIMYSIP